MKTSLSSIEWGTTIVLLACALQSRAQDPSSPPLAQAFDWNSITPSANLTWTTCFSTFQCGRFLVPFDYDDPSGDQHALAMVKVPAAVAPDDEAYRGPILFNPGGPGGSGVQFILLDGPVFQTVIGNEFDIIGFDPRGVGQTTPNLNVFASRQQALSYLQQSNEALNATSASLGHAIAMSQIVGDQALANAQHQTEHMSTPEVARDMLNIVKAHGRDKLQYVGFSYGTVLGVTYAAMFPDNVERIVLDGVVDSEDYYAGSWNNNLVDSDKALEWYYSDCVNAGPSVCPIWEPTVSQINERVNTLLERLKIAPISFVNSATGEFGVVDYNVAKTLLFLTMYGPHRAGADTAHAFAALEAGDAQPMWNISNSAILERVFEASCLPELASFDSDDVSTVAVGCGDGAPVESSLDELRQFYAKLAQQTVFADVWPAHLLCAGWKLQAKAKFTGNLSAKTSFPMLFVGNTADPVTPLRSARKMASGFPGSVVLHQNSPGHSSKSAVSPCTLNYYRQYFRDGTLPEPGTVCEVEGTSFSNTPNNFRARAVTPGAEDDGVFAALREAAIALKNGKRIRRFI